MKSRRIRRIRRQTNKRLRRKSSGKSRGKRTQISKRRMNKYFGGKIIQEQELPNHNGKNILLIIDPQNDFSDKKEGVRGPGNLEVVGSTLDYARIIKFIEANAAKLDEIHVSLDTHTERHIGHPAFWTRVDENGTELLGEETDDTDGLRILSIVEGKNNIYKGLSVVPMGAPVSLHGKQQIRYYTPRKYDEGQYDALLKYVKEYIEFYYTPENKHGLFPWIWRNHCLEGTNGHEVVRELKACLDKYSDKVKYHIKGQNNLAEMYSIFSAEKPVTDEIALSLSNYVYTGKCTNPDKLPVQGVQNYDEIIKYKNLDTEPNLNLMKYLLGDTNRVFVCGQAKTHCVKSSLIDLMEHAQGVNADRIVLLGNMSSPIPGAEDNLEAIIDKPPTKDGMHPSWSEFTVFIPKGLIPIIQNNQKRIERDPVVNGNKNRMKQPWK